MYEKIPQTSLSLSLSLSGFCFLKMYITNERVSQIKIFEINFALRVSNEASIDSRRYFFLQLISQTCV